MKRHFKIVLALLSVSIILLVTISKITFGDWVTVTTLFRHKTENRLIEEQMYDQGALGYGGTRIVETGPFLYFWVLSTEIDTSEIDKNEWVFINEPGDIRFP